MLVSLPLSDSRLLECSPLGTCGGTGAKDRLTEWLALMGFGELGAEVAGDVFFDVER